MSYRTVFAPNIFSDQVALVTGGGSGIGRCTAHELASLGAHVIVAGRTRQKLEAVCQEISDDGGKASFATFDIRDDEAVEQQIAALLEEHGRLSFLVNNAGGQFFSSAERISPNGFDAVVRNNLHGGFFLAREVYLQHMSKHGGAIVNIIADMWNGMPGMAHSGAARAATLNLTKTLAVEWAKSGVRVNAVAPGWIASSGLDSYDPAVKPVLRKLRHAVPLKRLGNEAEVSAAICFLLSPAAAFISGACLRVDGAASLATHVWPLQEHDRSPVFDGFHRSKLPKLLEED
jgi:citronellol/citronellal dehydrogenase